jgi:hypothetical protein
MRRYILSLGVVAIILGTTVNSAEAQLGTLLREGTEYMGRQAQKLISEGVEAGAKKAVGGADEVAKAFTSKIITTGGKEAGEQLIVQSGKHVARMGVSSADEVLAHLGPAGVQSMAKLSPVGANRLAEVSVELAKSPYKTEWLRLIGESGDAVATFLWERKLSVGVAAAATAAVLAPDEFLQASEGVLTTTISVAGEHVMAPLITQTAQHVAGPIAQEVTKQATANFPLTLVLCATFACVAGGLLYRRLRRR